MSSLQSAFAQAKTRPTAVFPITTTSYSDSDVGEDMPIPFYVTRQGLLEIRIQDEVTANLLTPGSFVGLNSTPDFNCKIMGGAELVLGLGQTVKVF